LAAALSSPAAWANSITYTASVPLTPTSWSTTVSLPRFDPSLGTLTAVWVVVDCSGVGHVQIESQDAVPTGIASHGYLMTELRRPDNSFLVGVHPNSGWFDQVSSFDGVVDFSGASGFTHSFGAGASASHPLPSISDRSLFTGPSGNPGMITLPLVVQERIDIDVSGGSAGNTLVGTLQTSLSASSVVTLRYEFTPGVGAPFCAGDGSGTICPCGNTSAVGTNQGCTNSQGSGASLVASGTPEVGNDTLALQCSGLPSGTTALLFQGTARENSGSGTLFGDGLRCVGGTVHRLGTTQAPGGMATWPLAGAPSLSIAGSAQSGELLHYQVWYRNAALFCTPETFNLSQGLSVAWVM
jgi:hypothetical protein